MKNLYSLILVVAVLFSSGCENKKQTEEIESLKSDLNVALSNLESASSQIANLSSDLDAESQRNDELTEQISALTETLNTMKEAEATRKRIAAEKAEAERLAALNVEIEDDCTVNGFGKVTCTFKNTGTGTGSVCVVPYLKRAFQGEYLEGKYKNSLYDDYPEITASGEICSGLVRGGDVAERSKQLAFTVDCDKAGLFCWDPSPSDFCSQKSSYTSWHTGCFFGTREASD